MRFKEWLKLQEAEGVAGCGGDDCTKIPQFKGQGTWMGAAAGGEMSSAGPVKITKAEKARQKKK